MLLLLGVVIGYFAAVFAASNILLPLFWAWPKARRLSHAKQNAEDGFTFFNSPVTIGQAYKNGNEVAHQSLNSWSEWIDLTRRNSGNARAGTPVVRAMLKKTGSESPLTEPDQQRLWPLACWFEGWIPTIDSSFDQLTGAKKQ